MDERIAMYFVQEQDVPGDRMEAPHARVVKHLIAPWNAGSNTIWMGISVIDPESSSNEHAHEDQEEIFYCLSGKGKIKVENEMVVITTGSCVFVPKGTLHQLINTQSNEVLRVLSATAPPFNRAGWADVHHAGTGQEQGRG